MPGAIARNPDGTVATVTDARGKVTLYGYDGAGNLTSMTPPAPMGATTIGYDSLSRVTSVRDGAGRTTRYPTTRWTGRRCCRMTTPRR